MVLAWDFAIHEASKAREKNELQSAVISKHPAGTFRVRANWHGFKGIYRVVVCIEVDDVLWSKSTSVAVRHPAATRPQRRAGHDVFSSCLSRWEIRNNYVSARCGSLVYCAGLAGVHTAAGLALQEHISAAGPMSEGLPFMAQGRVILRHNTCYHPYPFSLSRGSTYLPLTLHLWMTVHFIASSIISD
jgi:hypothetical protein